MKAEPKTINCFREGDAVISTVSHSTPLLSFKIASELTKW